MMKAIDRAKTISNAFNAAGFHSKLMEPFGPKFQHLPKIFLNNSLEQEKWVWKEGKVIFVPKAGKDYLEPKSWWASLGKLESNVAARLNYQFEGNFLWCAIRLLQREWDLADAAQSVRWQLIKFLKESLSGWHWSGKILPWRMTSGILKSVIVRNLARLVHCYISNRQIQIGVNDDQSKLWHCKISQIQKAFCLSPYSFYSLQLTSYSITPVNTINMPLC